MLILHHYHGGLSKFAALNRLLHTDRFMPALLLLALVTAPFLLCPGNAEAALNVTVIEARATDHYEVARRYGGEVRTRRASNLGFRHTGELIRLHVEEGDAVAPGQLLAELDPEPLAAQLDAARAAVAHADAGIDVATAALSLAQETLIRFEDLVARGHASRQRFDEVRLDVDARSAELAVSRAAARQARARLKAAEIDLARSRIQAPYAGRVQARLADEGTLVTPGQTVLRLVETTAPEARIGVPQDVADDLAPGSRHRFRIGERLIEGELLQLLPEVDARTRTVTALFALDEAGAPPAGSMVELELDRAVLASGYWLPLTALTEAQRGLWSVFVVRSQDGVDITERRLVEVLHTDRDRVYAQGTLADGERIVVTGMQRIVPGQAVVSVVAP
jgi:RND family efflux transporter MFP subunit